MPRAQAALQGAREVGFTVLAMSSALIAVFLPIMLMAGLVGRVLREFALTLALAVALSLVVSLTTTPMLCGHLLRPPAHLGRFLSAVERSFNALRGFHGRTLHTAIRHRRAVMLVLLGFVHADESISFQAMQSKMRQIEAIVRHDAAVAHVVAFTVGGLFISQILTLYTTPVVYIYLERFRAGLGRVFARGSTALAAPETGSS